MAILRREWVTALMVLAASLALVTSTLRVHDAAIRTLCLVALVLLALGAAALVRAARLRAAQDLALDPWPKSRLARGVVIVWEIGVLVGSIRYLAH
jgi:hypothetical protein